MKKIREILRMHECEISDRGIASALNVSRPTVSDYLAAFRKAGIDYAKARGMNDEDLLGSISKPVPIPDKRTELTNKFPRYVYGSFRLNRACKRAYKYGNPNYRTVKNILEKGLDNIEEEQTESNVLPLHENVRGEAYYGNGDSNE